jgi:putative FmdB family regulatory protein
MPLYEYACRKCEHHFERLLRGSEIKEAQPCPRCGEDDCQKQISQSSFSLKGDGWAEDGYSGRRPPEGDK